MRESALTMAGCRIAPHLALQYLGFRFPRLQNCEKEISVLHKLSNLRCFVIASQWTKVDFICVTLITTDFYTRLHIPFCRVLFMFIFSIEFQLSIEFSFCWFIRVYILNINTLLLIFDEANLLVCHLSGNLVFSIRH